jgi:2-C-methyl-D-erythritol 4-phosphate cytidylyltransferase
MRPFISVILLSGGKGTRMNSSIPKQYLELSNKKIVIHSFEFFASLEEVAEIIVVCEEEYESIFSKDFLKSSQTLKFAKPGVRRQDSVYNGLCQTSSFSDLVCIHDGARPFLKKEEVLACFSSAFQNKAAILASKVQNTIKLVSENVVEKTIDRDFLYEIYTPQVFEKDLLMRGFDFVIKNNLNVTDDASIIELLGKKVTIVEGSKSNIKITTPLDLQLARFIHATSL